MPGRVHDQQLHAAAEVDAIAILEQPIDGHLPPEQAEHRGLQRLALFRVADGVEHRARLIALRLVRLRSPEVVPVQRDGSTGVSHLRVAAHVVVVPVGVDHLVHIAQRQAEPVEDRRHVARRSAQHAGVDHRGPRASDDVDVREPTRLVLGRDPPDSIVHLLHRPTSRLERSGWYRGWDLNPHAAKGDHGV